MNSSFDVVLRFVSVGALENSTYKFEKLTVDSSEQYKFCYLNYKIERKLSLAGKNFSLGRLLPEGKYLYNYTKLHYSLLISRIPFIL